MNSISKTFYFGLCMMAFLFFITPSTIFAATNYQLNLTAGTYNPVAKTLEITGSVTALQTGTLAIDIEYSADQALLGTGKLKTLQIFSHPLMTVNQTEKISPVITLTGINPGTLFVQGIDGNTKQRSNVITLNAVPVNDPTSGIIISMNSAYLTLYFSPSNTDNVSVDEDTIILQGNISSQITNSPLKLNLYLGETTNSLQEYKIIDIAVPVSNKKYFWKQYIGGLDSGKKYYYQFRDGTDPNPDHRLGDIYTVTTAGVLDPANNQNKNNQNTSGFGQSPAGSDNSGSGGIFSYKYPTNIGAPAGSVNSMGDASGPIVPCTATGDITTRCTFVHLMDLIGRIFDYALVLLLPIIALIAAFTGIQMIILKKGPDMSNPVKLEELKSRAFKILVGVIVILLAWTLVATLLSAVLGPEAKKYILLDLPSLK